MRHKNFEAEPPRESWQLEDRLKKALESHSASDVLSTLYTIDRVLCRAGETCRPSLREDQIEQFLKKGEGTLTYPLHVENGAALHLTVSNGTLHCTVDGADAAVTTWDAVR